MDKIQLFYIGEEHNLAEQHYDVFEKLLGFLLNNVNI